jgi:hypothetical protein
VKRNHALPNDIPRKVLSPLPCGILDINIQTILNEDKMNPDGIMEVVKNVTLPDFSLGS